MKVKDLLLNNHFKGLSKAETFENEFKDVYIGDLLSWVMGQGKPNSIWLTVLGHMNIVAVAALREFPCILICENASISEDVIEQANEEGIAILQTDLTSYEVSKLLMKAL